MDFSLVIDSIITYFQSNLYIALAIAALFIFLLFRKTKLFFIIIIIVLLTTGVFYLISNIAATGVTHTQKMIGTQ